MPVRERGTASTNVTHHLRFKTEEEAEKVLRKILAEMSSAPGTGGLTGDDPGGKDTAKDVAPPVVRSIESEEIQAARASFEAIKRRYRYKHPDYQQALLKVLELEMKVQKQK